MIMRKEQMVACFAYTQANWTFEYTLERARSLALLFKF